MSVVMPACLLFAKETTRDEQDWKIAVCVSLADKFHLSLVEFFANLVPLALQSTRHVTVPGGVNGDFASVVARFHPPKIERSALHV